MERVASHTLLRQYLRKERNDALKKLQMEPWEGVSLSAQLLTEQIVPQDEIPDVITDLITASKVEGRDPECRTALAMALVSFDAKDRLETAAGTFAEEDASQEAINIRLVLAEVVKLTAPPATEEPEPATAGTNTRTEGESAAE